MGIRAGWANPDQIKRRLYGKVREQLEARLDRPVELIVEKDKDQPGSIYRSMYSEAWLADVYLVDLTGANANVYLELGVRWAMSDGVTVLIAQDPADLPFNVVAARAQPYSNDPDQLESSIERIVNAVLVGLKARQVAKTDSPVRDGAEFITVPSARIKALESRIEELQQKYGDSYLDAAARSSTLQTKIHLLQLAVEVNPFTPEGHFQLGRALRESGDADDDAVQHLRKATELSPRTSNYWRELGVVLSKSGQLDAAIPALKRGINLAPADVDAMSVLGGVKRRIALSGGAGNVDWEALKEAKELYEKASLISPRDVYPLLNVARIGLMLSGLDSSALTDAKARFGKALPLCQFELQYAKDQAAEQGSSLERQIEAGFRFFDYGDCLLFTGRITEGLQVYTEGFEYLRAEIRSDVMRSVGGALDDLADLVDLDPETTLAIQNALKIIRR